MSEAWREVLRFWFTDAAADPAALEKRMAQWFTNDERERAAFDDSIRAQFGATIDAAVRGDLEDWVQSAHGRLAVVLVLDQFARNVHRGSERAFSGDARALELVQQGMKGGADLLLSPLERYFFYMPLQHAEDAAVQQRSVEVFRKLASEAPPQLHEFLTGGIGYAEMHRDLVLRFGRFPHRNALLGRASTAAEREYLAGDVPDFGQN